MTGDSRLYFAVLGSFRVDRDGRELDPGPRLQRTLLAILVVEAGHVVPVDRLMDLLWRDEPPAAAIASVQAYVSQLRRVLEPGRPARAPARVLVTQDPGYVLRVADDQVDAPRFQALARRAHNDLAGGQPAAAAAGLEDALALWRGDPLAEFADEPWAVPVVARLTEAHDLATEDRIDAWLALGRHARAAAELEAMVEARPLRERRWGQLIVATYRCGRQADALRAYQRCRTILAGELGLEPGPELRRLEAAVLAQDPSLDWRPNPAAAAAAAPAPPVPAGAQPAAPPPAAEPPAPPLVGRDAELTHLRGALRQAASGHGGAVVLVGEPGAGKTRLAEAAAAVAAAAGVTAVWGRCLDAASTPAFWPWSQVLRALPDGPLVQAARQRLDGVAGEGEDSARQFRAYQAVAAALGEAAAGAPMLAVVDDLHAADDASLALLQLLSGDLHRMAVLLLFTVRDTEPSRRLGQALGELLRHPGAERMPVCAFEPADVAALVERLTAEPPRAGVVAALMDRTSGNPFYTTELVRLISSEHRRQPLTAGDVQAHDVPSGIRDVLLRRAGRLPEDTQSLLMVAAVAGRELQPDLLEHVTGIDAEQLLLALEPAIAAGLVTTAEGGWGFRFRHPLIHESLYASVGRVERARLHARVAAALEDISSASTADVVQLAYHYLSAGPFGDPAKAVRYAREAGARAVRQGAWQDAARHLEQALTAVSPALPDADTIRCDVLVELGHARRSEGKIREAHRAFDESISLADRIGDEDRVLAAAVAFGAPQLWGSREWGETDPRLITLLERQLGRIGDRDPARRVRVLATLAMELNSDQTALRGWGYANEALDIARRLGQPEELGSAISAYLFSAGELTDHVPQLRAVLDEMLQGGKGDLTPQVQAIMLARLLTERIRSGDLGRFDTEFEQAWRLAAVVLHSPELQIALRMVEACRYFVAGDVERGTGLMVSGHQAQLNLITDDREPGRFVLDSCRMLLTGTLADHAEQIAARLVQPDHPSIPHLAAPAAALGFAQRGDVERARQIASRWFTPSPRSWTWMQPIAYWAQVAAIVGVPDPGWLYGRLAPHAGQLAIVGMVTDGGGAVDSLLAGLALHLGRLDEAAEHAQAGLALETRVGSLMWINRTKDLINRIAAARAHARSRDQIAAAAHEGTVSAARPAQAVTAAGGAFELSARELEVARLVADGLSNPAIASALFVSVPTVKTHVSHILAKLGLDSRVQLASWVAGHDLGPPAPARG
jgi:DNA-binding SARP family transcriptional activator/DNA-binding CsgD family transcriptional regulator